METHMINYAAEKIEYRARLRELLNNKNVSIEYLESELLSYQKLEEEAKDQIKELDARIKMFPKEIKVIYWQEERNLLSKAYGNLVEITSEIEKEIDQRKKACGVQ